MKIARPWLDNLALTSAAALQQTIGLVPRVLKMMFDILTFCVMFSVALLLLVFGTRNDETPDHE
jgi:hypothetical protein